MELPPSSHFIYIPVVLILGLVLGFIWGARVTQESYALEAKRTEERLRKKAERQAARESARQSAGAGPENAAAAGAEAGAPANEARQDERKTSG
jgi:hypothetical protein